MKKFHSVVVVVPIEKWIINKAIFPFLLVLLLPLILFAFTAPPPPPPPWTFPQRSLRSSHPIYCPTTSIRAFLYAETGTLHSVDLCIAALSLQIDINSKHGSTLATSSTHTWCGPSNLGAIVRNTMTHRSSSNTRWIVSLVRCHCRPWRLV